MKLTDPYDGLDPIDTYDLINRVSIPDAHAILNVFPKHETIRLLISNFVAALAAECRLLSIDDAEYVLQRCAEGIPFRRSGEDERPRPSGLGRAGDGKIQKGT